MKIVYLCGNKFIFFRFVDRMKKRKKTKSEEEEEEVIVPRVVKMDFVFGVLILQYCVRSNLVEEKWKRN